MSIKTTRPAGHRIKAKLPNHRPAAPDHLARIAALSRNARATWLSLLGVLLFVGITLLGFAHIDFYGYDRQTELPLIGVSVPTRFFFYTSPLLLAANYIYFHLYLIRLWDALGDAPARVNGTPLGRAVPPWLVTDAALWLRNRRRRDESTDKRPLEGVAAILNTLLTWGFGLAVGAMTWWQSAVARELEMTAIAAIALTAMVLVGVASFGALWRRMGVQSDSSSGALAWISAIALGVAIAFPTYYRSHEPAPWMVQQAERKRWNDELQAIETYQTDVPIFANRDTAFSDRFWTLAEVDLEGEALVERPADWLPYDLAIEDDRRNWCARENRQDCSDFGEDEDRFNNEFWARQRNAHATLKRPTWHGPGRTKPDLRGANLRASFLLGLSLSEAQMQGADLSAAQMQGAELSAAQMQGAELSAARMQGANLISAQMQGAELSAARMQGANLISARMQGADLSAAQMQGANLNSARMQGANLSLAQMQGARLVRAQMQGADLSAAQMQGANLKSAQMQGANLNSAQMQGANLVRAQMQGANLKSAQMQGADLQMSILTGHKDNARLAGTDIAASRNNGGAVKDMDFSGTNLRSPLDWRNAFLDGSVTGKTKLIAAMGLSAPPCHWVAEKLSDEDFYGHWRGWIDAKPNPGLTVDWRFFAPTGFANVAAIPPPVGCTWATDPPPSMPD